MGRVWAHVELGSKPILENFLGPDSYHHPMSLLPKENFLSAPPSNQSRLVWRGK